jgi:hypothetical protein
MCASRRNEILRLLQEKGAHDSPNKSATCRDARSSTSLLVIAHCLHRQGDEDARVIRRFPVHEVRWVLLCISTLSVFMDRSLLTLPLLGPVSVDCGRLLLFPFRPLPVTIARRTSESSSRLKWCDRPLENGGSHQVLLSFGTI